MADIHFAANIISSLKKIRNKSIGSIVRRVVHSLKKNDVFNPKEWPFASERRRVYDCLHVMENVCFTRKSRGVYVFRGLDSIAEYVNELRNASLEEYSADVKGRSQLSIITSMVLIILSNHEGITLDLLTHRIFQRFSKDMVFLTYKSAERRIYDVMGVLTTIGIVEKTKQYGLIRVRLSNGAIKPFQCATNAWKAIEISATRKKRMKRGGKENNPFRSKIGGSDYVYKHIRHHIKAIKI